MESSKVVDDYYEIVLRYASEGVEGYPFSFEIIVSYRFGGVWLSVATEFINTGSVAIPAGFGWHPYFRIGESVDCLQLILPEVEKIEVNERLIPTGKKSICTDYSKPAWINGAEFDTGFRLLAGQREVQLYDSKSGLSLMVSMVGDDNNYEYVQLYTPPGRQSIAIEPMTCATNAFNNGWGVAKLKPKDSLKAMYTILVS